MKLIVENVIRKRTLKHEYEDWDYFEKYENNRLVDCYFAQKGATFPDGSLKRGCHKHFYSNQQGEDIKKEVKRLHRVSEFKYFDKLYYIDENGDVYREDGTPAKDCIYQVI